MMQMTPWFLIGLCIYLNDALDRQLSCPTDNWEQWGRMCYKAYPARTYDEAAAICEQFDTAIAAITEGRDEFHYLTRLCGQDGTECWTNGDSNGWQKGTFNKDDENEACPFDSYLTENDDEYGTIITGDAADGSHYVLNGQTWKLNVGDDTDEYPVICKVFY
eukprot:UN25325